MAIGADESSSRLMQRVESCSQLLRQVLAGKDYIFNGISMSTDDIPRGLSSPDISVYKYIHMYIYIYMHVDDIPGGLPRRLGARRTISLLGFGRLGVHLGPQIDPKLTRHR